MEVRRHGDRLWTFAEFPNGTWEARMYYLVNGTWEPPLPIGVQVPERSATKKTTIERLGARHGSLPTAARSATVTRSSAARRAVLEASPQRPAWQLREPREPEPWRLQR